MPTRLYPVDDKLAMYVDTVQKADRVTRDRIVNEATAWGMRRQLADETVADIVARLPMAISAAADQTPGVPDQLVQLVQSRTDQLIGTEKTSPAS